LVAAYSMSEEMMSGRVIMDVCMSPPCADLCSSA
jgi:hypothetical protein